MKKCLIFLLFLLFGNLAISQDNKTMMYVRIVDSNLLNPVECEVQIWKETEGGKYTRGSIVFIQQAKISLSKGKYTFYFKINDKIIHKDYIEVGQYDNSIIYNLYANPLKLLDADFNQISIITPEVHRFLNHRTVYIEL
jgi:hypothetical protein